jgi:hypothetical protein
MESTTIGDKIEKKSQKKGSSQWIFFVQLSIIQFHLYLQIAIIKNGILKINWQKNSVPYHQYLDGHGFTCNSMDDGSGPLPQIQCCQS